MKKNFLYLLVYSIKGYSQFDINTTIPHSSLMSDIYSIDKGLLIPCLALVSINTQV